MLVDHQLDEDDRRFRLVTTAYVARFFIESLRLPNVNRKKNPLCRTENGRMKNEASDWARLGPWVQEWGLNFLGAPESMQESIDRFDAPLCLTGRLALAWVETVGAGALCQKASDEGSGGVSAVIGSSDLDVHSLHRAVLNRNRCTCLLLNFSKGPRLSTLCLRKGGRSGSIPVAA